MVGGVGARCRKEVAIASSPGAAGLEDPEVAVPVIHSGRKQAEVVLGCCYMGLAALRRSHTSKEQKNYDENLSKHLHADALG